ncbi:hypothetical protein CEP50_17735 [Actinopolyspora mortivallis]|uniref:Uncharacterized protein n=2 Tax=Actinopolyspora mortivallis TaxID=33906 RepID=A0A2T0GSB6_ACTMO|nr:hypothetical protein CEP50_17735 [Actinopolyspora mortivallis]
MPVSIGEIIRSIADLDRAAADVRDLTGEPAKALFEFRSAAERVPSEALAAWLCEEADRAMGDGEWSEYALAYAREVNQSA